MTTARTTLGALSCLTLIIGILGGMLGAGAQWFIYCTIGASVAALLWGLVVNLDEERTEETK